MLTREEFKEKLDRACNLINWLKETHNVEATICGGCARDIYFGLIPKDVDVVV